MKQLYEVGGWVGKSAILVAVTFAAYLVGSILELRATRVTDWLWKKVAAHYLRKGTLHEKPYWVLAGSQLSRPMAESLKNYVMEKMSLDEEGRDFTPAQLEERGSALLALHSELPQIRTRLYTVNKDMYGEYDRAAAEADLKSNVALAGIFLSVVLAVRLTPLWAFICIPMALLLVRGLLGIRQANDVLVRAITSEVIQSSRFETRAAEFRKAAGAPVRKDWRQRLRNDTKSWFGIGGEE
ncbi:hypothetical protein ACWC0C_47335 [Streptomyces sp. NPDC001709]